MDYMTRLHAAYERWAEDMTSKTKVISVPWNDYSTPGWQGVYDRLITPAS